MSEEIKFTDMQVLSLQPGDIVVLRHPAKISERQFHFLQETMKGAMPGVRVMILEDGMDIGILRQEEVQDGTE